MTSKTKKSETVRNQLGYQQFYKLCLWITENYPKLQNLRVVDALDKIRDSTGITVTAANLRSLRETTEVPLILKGERTVEVNNEQVIAMELVKLLEKMGEPVNPELQAIANGAS